MISKEKALYQVKVILDYLPEEEYNLISNETIEYIEDNFEYDENFTIDPSIPLEKQNIDEKAYDFLEKIVKEAERNKKDNISFNNTRNYGDGINYLDNDKDNNKNKNDELVRENIKLKELVEALKEENSKLPKAKTLIEEYKNALEKKDEEIKELKKNNQELYNLIQKIPNIIRKLFLKQENKKLLSDKTLP